MLFMDSKQSEVLKKYKANLVYFHFGDYLNIEEGDFYINEVLITAIVKSQKPIVLTEGNISVIIYNIETPKVDFLELTKKHLSIKAMPSVDKISDDQDFDVSGLKVKPNTGFLEVISEKQIDFYGASLLREPVNRI